MSGLASDVRFSVPTVPKNTHLKTLIESMGLEFWNSRDEKPDRITANQKGVERGTWFKGLKRRKA